MAVNWQEVFTTIGSTAVIVSAFTFLTKSVINHLLTRDAEKFKARLKADTDIEIEKLKHSLEKVAVEHQVRFSKLHEKRADVIADLYARLVDAERDADHFVKVEAWDDRRRREANATTEQKLVDLYFFVEKDRIYLPEPVCDLLTNFVLAVRSNAVSMNIFAPIEPSSNPTFNEERVKVIKEVFDSVQGKIPAARKALEAEFRTILGG